MRKTEWINGVLECWREGIEREMCFSNTPILQYSNTPILQYSILQLRITTYYVLDMKFEEALKNLEKSVEQLESGDLPLEKALEVFENGIKMSHICSKKLEEAEQKVELLLGVSDDGEAQTTLFDTDMLEGE